MVNIHILAVYVQNYDKWKFCNIDNKYFVVLMIVSLSKVAYHIKEKNASKKERWT